MRTIHKRYGNYSGVLIRGTTHITIPETTNHEARAALLAATVESGGRFGTVMNYDGTGMTAGIIQCVAVLPRDLQAQGSLWPLLQKIDDVHPDLTEHLFEQMDNVGWELSDGKVISLDNGKLITGREIRQELTPPNGKVPPRGPEWLQASAWASLFYDIFSHPDTFDIQLEEAKRHFYNLCKRRPPVLSKQTVNQLVYAKAPTLTPEDPLDLAMSVFFSNAVNAPTPSFRVLRRALKDFPNTHLAELSDRKRVAKDLLRMFRLSTYGNWKKRYKRTRSAAMKMWPKDHFSGPDTIMFR